MKKMKWLYVLLATFLLTSCGTLMQPYQMDSKMKDIELGMTKKKVISILGKDFESAGGPHDLRRFDRNHQLQDGFHD